MLPPQHRTRPPYLAMEWQWLGGCGGSRFARSRRFEWCRLGCGSGSIGRDMTVVRYTHIFLEKNQCRMVKTTVDGKGWQWLGKSGTVGYRRSARFELCLFERVSGSIDRVVVMIRQHAYFC
jgi:hypothetical protein